MKPNYVKTRVLVCDSLKADEIYLSEEYAKKFRISLDVLFKQHITIKSTNSVVNKQFTIKGIISGYNSYLSKEAMDQLGYLNNSEIKLYRSPFDQNTSQLYFDQLFKYI